jgi:RimJ/RimL family protein N-acetyltransferase
VGSTLLRELERHALGLGFAEVGTSVDDPGSLAFAQQFGLVEVDRQIEQVRQIGHEPAPDLPAGVSLASVAERPELWAPAFDGLAVEAYGDMATDRPITISRQEWQQEATAWPEAMFLALDRDEVIGCAGLARDADAPERAEHALTAVRRSWRRRGIATLLKRRCLAFAAANGIAEVYTWTQRDNAAMIVLNQRLGYRRRGESVTVRGPLPLQATAGPVSG